MIFQRGHHDWSSRISTNSFFNCEYRILLDAHVTTGSTVDGHEMLGRVDHMEKTFNFKVEEITADRGYGYGESLDILDKRGTQTYIPNFLQVIRWSL